MRDGRMHFIFFLLGVGMIFLGAGLEFSTPHSLTSGTCFGIGGMLFIVHEILRRRSVYHS